MKININNIKKNKKIKYPSLWKFNNKDSSDDGAIGLMINNKSGLCIVNGEIRLLDHSYKKGVEDDSHWEMLESGESISFTQE